MQTMKDNKEEKIIIQFGLKMIKTTLIAFLVATVISLYMEMFFEGMLLLVSIIALRQYAGGYHTNSQKICALLSCIIYATALIIIKKFFMHGTIQLAVCIISAIVIYYLSPVDNPNNKLTYSEKKYIKSKVRAFLSIEIMFFVFLLINGAEYWSKIVIISMMIVAILVIIGFIKNKVRGNA